VTRDSRAGGGAESGQNIDHSLRESGFDDQLSDPQRAERRLLGRLHYHRVSRGQCRGELPGLHQHGEVPGDDLSHHADRFQARVTEIVAVDRNGLALNLIRPSGEITVAADGGGDVDGFGHAKRLSVVERLQARQLIGVLLDQVGQAIEQPSSFGCGRLPPSPSLERGAGRFDGPLHVNCVGFGDLTDLLAGGGIDGGESFAGFAWDPAIINQKLRRRNSGVAFRGR